MNLKWACVQILQNVEELGEQEIHAHQTPMEILSEVEDLKKSLQYYKSQNGYLNDSND